MSISSWKYQIKRGTLEFCIISMINQQPTYGYEIISKLEKYPILAAKVHTALAGGSWCGTERQRGGGSGSVLM